MIYQMIERHGQVHVGYFVVDPKSRKMRIIKREQWRNRAIAEGRFDKRCQTTANIARRHIVRFVVSPDQGQVESYDSEANARAAMAASMLPVTDGLTRAIEVHLYHPVKLAAGETAPAVTGTCLACSTPLVDTVCPNPLCKAVELDS